MFQPAKSSTSRIHHKLRSEVSKIEERSPSLRVLVARQIRYPVLQRELRVRVDTTRKLNLLEKYILRAATELYPPPGIPELAQILHLDATFIDLVCQQLSETGYLEVTPGGLLLPTREGQRMYTLDEYTAEPDFQIWYYQQDPISLSSECRRDPLPIASKEVQQLDDVSDFLNRDLAMFPAFDKAPLTDYNELGLTCHDPDNDRYVTDLQPTAEDELRWRTLGLFVIYDELAENSDEAITLQLRLGTMLLQELSQELMQKMQDDTLRLEQLCGETSLEVLTHEARQAAADVDSQLAHEVDSHIEDLRAAARVQMRRDKAGLAAPLSGGTVQQLHDNKIRDAFFQALRSATQRIIIYFPWMNEQTVDRTLRDLLANQVKKGVRVLIGYGISRDEHEEKRLVPPSLRQSLHAIRTFEGTQGIVADWLGNTRAEEVIIDNTLHLNGSHRWFSYRGDLYPRGETVYEVSIPTEVAKAYEHLGGRFRQRALERWQANTNDDRQMALLTLCFLAEERLTLTLPQQEQEYTLLPLWITLVRQILSTQTEERLLPALQTLQTILNESQELDRLYATEMQVLCKRFSPAAQQIMSTP